MPTFKHPCPRCGQFIARDVVRCPFCGAADPFVPGRCPTCRTPIDDARWVACPKCGAALGPAAVVSGPGVIAETQAAGAPGGAAPATPGGPVGDTPPPAAATTPPPAAVPATTTPPSPNIASTACGGCGSALPPGARFCTVCGTLAG